ncbi:cyclic nucleotide-gated ion channel 4-like [Zingiber officinale]|uniref:Cyclic nucleotide-binding domain-containing protein n=1 Tax=Zingiber officinale TaxID=94328 RepID=A0A8J5G2R5_ZINOF|nr:cyclic nucleotide-gated ion channel 4-like [Zingiber officinale]KAG6495238.1 hypothetical protein ZIOFF_043032 [Zingiber officinale]
MSTPESLVPSPDARVSPACGDHRRRRRLPMAFLHHLNSIQEWNRVFLLVCAAGLVIDPLFFYSLSISAGRLCLFVDGWFAVSVTVLRCMADLVHLVNVYLQLAAGPSDAHYTPSPASAVDGAEARGSGAPRARGYLRSKTGFLLDLFIVLPIPQIVLWIVTPAMLRRGMTTKVMTVFFISFVFQYFPKIYHSVCFLRRLQSMLGYVFGTIWGGIALNLIAYFVASHAAGACWYLLGIQRAAKCLTKQCVGTTGCRIEAAACIDPIYFGDSVASLNGERRSWAKNLNARATCLDSSDQFDYGSYRWIVPLVTNSSRVEKVLFPIFWGLMTLSTFGTIESTTEWLEIAFNIVIVTSALLLVTTLIGNIKVFLHATTSKKQALHSKMRSLDRWMRRRNMPVEIRQRVRQYERQRWAAMRGVDELDMTRQLPDGMRRDIKYHLCLDLVRQVPLFQHMDELVLENICDRVKSLIFPKGEIITREGDPVQRMLFVVRGHMQSSQRLRDRVRSHCMLGPGNFSGDELLSWCLRRPFVDRLPPSTSTLVAVESTEAFGLDAEDLKYVTQHFRHTFVSERVRRSVRYYSPGWRTWAAVAIQLAWWQRKQRRTLTSLSFVRPRRPTSRSASMEEERLRLYTALLTSPKPNQDDFAA